MTSKQQAMAVDRYFAKGDKRRGQALAVYAEGYVDGKNEILGREKSMKCLRCGLSLVKEIFGNKIHLHLCEKCRIVELNKMTKEILHDK